MSDAKPVTEQKMIDDLLARSKDDHASRMIVGSEVRWLIARIDALRARAEQAEADRKVLGELVTLLSDEAEAWVKHQGHEWDGTGYYGGVVRKLRDASAAIARAGEVKP